MLKSGVKMRGLKTLERALDIGLGFCDQSKCRYHAVRLSACGACAPFGFAPSWVPASDFWSVSCSQPCTERKARSKTFRDSLPRPQQPQPHESSARQGKGLFDHGDFVISIAAAESVQGRSSCGSGRWCCLTDSIFCAAHP